MWYHGTQVVVAPQDTGCLNLKYLVGTSGFDRPDNNEGCPASMKSPTNNVPLYLEIQKFCVTLKSWRFR